MTVIIYGRQLREIRIEKKMTQKEMADYFGVTRGTYSCWESRYKDKLLPRKKYQHKFLLLQFSKNEIRETKPVIASFPNQICYKRKKNWFTRLMNYLFGGC